MEGQQDGAGANEVVIRLPSQDSDHAPSSPLPHLAEATEIQIEDVPESAQPSGGAAPENGHVKDKPKPHRGPASDAFVSQMISLPNHDQNCKIMNIQNDCLLSLLSATEDIAQFNKESAATYSKLSSKFSKHTKNLKELKADLSFVYKKVIQIKQKLLAAYPQLAGVVEDNDSEGEETKTDLSSFSSR